MVQLLLDGRRVEWVGRATGVCLSPSPHPGSQQGRHSREGHLASGLKAQAPSSLGHGGQPAAWQLRAHRQAGPGDLRLWVFLSSGIPELGRRVCLERRRALQAPGVGEAAGVLCRALSSGTSLCPQQRCLEVGAEPEAWGERGWR